MNGFQVPIADAAGMKMQRRILHSWKEIASYVGRGSGRFNGMKRSLACQCTGLAAGREAQ